MRHHSASFLLIAFLFSVGSLFAEERPAIYPFDVTIDGQTAAVEGDPSTAIVAKIAMPVPANAELVVDGEPGMLIINLFPSNASAEVEPGAQPKIILVQEGTSTPLDATMDKSTLSPGIWLANVVFAGSTSRILFTVE